MDIYEFAKILDGREYLNGITKEEEKLAKELGYVVVFGQSDDLCELSGAIDDEIGAYKGTIIYLSKEGIFKYENGPECPSCKLYRDTLNKCKNIKAVWCGKEDYAWAYETDIPHVTFGIYEDEYPYCQGIVFDLNNL